MGQSMTRDALIDDTYLCRGDDIAQVGSTRCPISGELQGEAAKSQGE